MEILIIIPARGGSKGIPRKNLRNLAGRPLLSYAIETALKSKFKPDVFVSSDDDEILSLAKKLGANVVVRDVDIAKDQTTLDPVIYDAAVKAKKITKKNYDLIVTLQPTSPLLKVDSLDAAIEKMRDNTSIDTILSVISDRHLSWVQRDAKFVPNYAKRLNRQQLPSLYRETGGFLIARSHVVTADTRIGKEVDLQELGSSEGIDIDTYEDWNLCEYFLKRKKIVFVVSGNQTIGMGHVYNTLLLASDILNHSIMFLVDKTSQLAFDKIALKNYPVKIQETESFLDDIFALQPDCVINDCLDTTAEYIKALKEHGIKVINFEDLGTGAGLADLVVNSIYPEVVPLPNHYFGHEYFLLRDEFLMTDPIQINTKVNCVVLSFGGVDPNNYTKKVLDEIYDFCLQNSIRISVIVGMGYTQISSLSQYEKIKVHQNVSNISDFMKEADVIFTSAGRTIYEVASLGIPCLVLAQNAREMTHFFASEENGFVNLGLGYELQAGAIKKYFSQVATSFEVRQNMAKLMLKSNVTNGRKQVIQLIKQVIES